ncbi:uncharacterized protein DEA37_0005091, partial [Paragonimus westermani]
MDDYYEKNGSFYCRKDFKKLNSKKCEACKNPIHGDMVSVLDKFFHHRCFHCSVCKSDFTPGIRVIYC